jgi:hypothetical protein
MVYPLHGSHGPFVAERGLAREKAWGFTRHADISDWSLLVISSMRAGQTSGARCIKQIWKVGKVGNVGKVGKVG